MFANAETSSDQEEVNDSPQNSVKENCAQVVHEFLPVELKCRL